MALVVTPGASNADSYISVTDAATYFGKRHVSSAWDDLATTAAKEKVLKNATAHIDRLLRLYDTPAVILDQALAWPWDGWQLSISADSGSSTTELIDSYLKNSHWPNDYFNGGSVWVKDANDAAPEFEVRAVTDFVRSTGTLTCAAFSAALESGDNCRLFPPVPAWLKSATCEQAYFILEDVGTDQNDFQTVENRSAEGGSVTYKRRPVGEWLCRACYMSLKPYLPKNLGVERG